MDPAPDREGGGGPTPGAGRTVDLEPGRPWEVDPEGAPERTIARVLTNLRTMPPGIILFLAYALLILLAIGVTLPGVIALATGAMPITFQGLVVMILLAYTVFTTTLVLQRK